MSSEVVSSYDNFWYVLRLLHNYLSTFKVKFTLVKGRIHRCFSRIKGINLDFWETAHLPLP